MLAVLIELANAGMPLGKGDFLRRKRYLVT